MIWSEANIGGALCRQLFNRQFLVVNNCSWTGYECDLLVVTPNLRVVDVEIKISRADLKADAVKDKWWIRHGWAYGAVAPPPPTPRQWPPKVWKHYYALPADIWKPELADGLPAASGVLLLKESKSLASGIRVDCVRRSKPNKDATKLTAEHAIDIARLASLRMWDAFDALRAQQRQREAIAA